MSDFAAFLAQGFDRGGFETEDVLAAVLPLMREAVAIHATGQVAPLRGIAAVVVHDGRALGFASPAGLPRQHNDSRLREVQGPQPRGLEVMGESRRETDLDSFAQKITSLDVASADAEITRPAFIPGFVTWEHVIGHHDELTDVHSLGLILASLACGLDFADAEDVELFANSRTNLFSLARRLHPVLASVITEMTELHRGRRAQDLPSLIRRLETYRDQPVDLDIATLPGLENGTKKDKRAIIQAHLRDRLFEVSRRNKLLYFKSTQSTLNLTVASVPLVLDYRNVKPEDLLYWHTSLAQEISAGNALPLNRWLRMEEAPYLPGQLDKLISEARRDRAEYGFSQLRLVLAFLRWHNLKEAPEERIHSPLLLLPVDLAKKKGVKDHYTLTPGDTEAEVNPALRHYLKQIYNLDLPETIDLRTTTPLAFHEQLQAQIQATEPGVKLTLSDKPRIQLIHERAKQRVDQYRRRMKRSGQGIPAAKVDYSYDREDFRPLGLQVFQKKIIPAPLPLRSLAGAPQVPRQLNMVAEAKTFALVEDGLGNPYSWEFDLCSLTLANFNYRKMTLVRDYAQLISSGMANAAFDRVFSLEPRAVNPPVIPALPPSQQHLIIAADATQTGAIARARTGESFIIQGPPGTGKSQTITNLIADFVALGKRVLFVCEKRAAIDVVFHRLRQQGLDELCCLIHDSQTDKKEFILNLKQTYEQWLAAGDAADSSEAKRNAALVTLEAELGALEKFTSASSAANPLLLRLIELRGSAQAADVPQDEALPDYSEWQQGGDCVIRLANALEDLGAGPVFASHPLHWLNDLETPPARLEDLEQRLSDLDDALQQTDLPMEHWDTLGEVAQLLDFTTQLLPLARKNLLGLLDANSTTSAAFGSLCAELSKRQKALAATQKKTAHWRTKLPAGETTSALAQAENLKGFFGFLNPAWWRLRKVLHASYDFSRHAVKPTWTQVLADLAAEHAADAEVETVKEQCAQDFGIADPEALRQQLAALSAQDAPPAAVALRERLLAAQQGAAFVEKLAALAPGFNRLRSELGSTLFEPEQHSLATLASAVRELQEEMDALPELVSILQDLNTGPPRLARAVRTRQLTAAQLESACAAKSLGELYRADRTLQRFDGHVLKQKLDRVAAAHRQWLDHNAGWIRSQTRRRFMQDVQLAGQSAAALTSEQKLFKKTFSSGRRELEHEFGKTMRFKSIRDLAAGDSGQVVRDLKPIWLMSPLSVSDTLPLDADTFDVVIFDEASQIPVEEAVPAAYRAQQVIVVGDEMQLPPTSFFSTSNADDDEITLDEEGEKISVLMDADSFLAQSTRNLPSTLLAWHYRSRYEALISFSNAAFYGGELYTIPDRQIAQSDSAETRIKSPEQAAALVPGILGRPISFIHCEGMPYENRRNVGEAASIAQIVRTLLSGATQLSIGIAAFSEAQQDEIESALDSLAAADPAFASLLEAAYAREEDDQFCGLFVKNLENIQGDERDIILMSVCYGRDAGGRILMNFGPINQRGGEKRLNVIFSRARHHMVLLSSLRHSDITNDYNDGANALKNFLHYAENLSRGDAALARQVLDGLNPLKRKSLSLDQVSATLSAQIAAALRERGWSAEVQVGQSRFRCDVAARASGAAQHQVGLLLDVTGGAGVLERFHTQPSILKAFGWQVLVILAKDWWHDPQSVIERVERLLRNETEEETMEEPAEELPPIAEPTPPPPPPPPAPPATPSAPMGMQRFEFTEGGSKKFWEIGQSGCDMTVRYGRIGTNGQTQTKTFSDEARARREVQKLIAEKVRKGYTEVS
ncbi:WGR domain-containing protein [Prosthecobacter sp.]|uniref:WGR domain-containing protein n=1 Tax=Prosthecobacter sp. TaxID=1965333 RepID=UPI0037832DFE